jgi:hypothetical protein
VSPCPGPRPARFTSTARARCAEGRSRTIAVKEGPNQWPGWMPRAATRQSLGRGWIDPWCSAGSMFAMPTARSPRVPRRSLPSGVAFPRFPGLRRSRRLDRYSRCSRQAIRPSCAFGPGGVQSKCRSTLRVGIVRADARSALLIKRSRRLGTSLVLLRQQRNRDDDRRLGNRSVQPPWRDLVEPRRADASAPSHQ